MNIELLKMWIEDKIKLTFGEVYNSSVRVWFKGYRKALTDVLEFIKSMEKK